MRQVLDKAQLKDILQNAWSVYPQMPRLLKSHECLRKCHSHDTPREIRKVYTITHAWLNPGVEKVKIKNVYESLDFG